MIYPVDNVIHLLNNWGLMFGEYDLFRKVYVRTSNLSTVQKKIITIQPLTIVVLFLAALLVRFLCHRFIGEYDPTIG